ncbi:MAG: hypothetical protein NTY53_23465 [Kiritimatiellaeota bacterium]|nr:hypothetical protein [Kiritimatiellota bacterium]
MNINIRRLWMAGGVAAVMLFAPAQAVNITCVANPTNGGRALVAGVTTTNVVAGTWLQIQAIASNTWWLFTGWSDGTQNNPEFIQAPAIDTVYTANFSPLAYLRGVVGTGVGTVSGGGPIISNQTVQLTAIPSAGYMFNTWTDSNMQNPRSITVNWAQGTTNTYTANFIPLTTGTLVVTNGAGGSAAGGGVYPVGQVVTIAATASNNFVFTGWIDGNLANPRLVSVPAGTTTYTASFTNLVNVTVAASMGGSTSGGGIAVAGSTLQISAQAQPGWSFGGWSDGSLANPRFITVPNANIAYVAQFVPVVPPTPPSSVNVSVWADPPAGGAANGGGAYAAGSTQQLSAVAKYGWTFASWSDGNIANPRSLVVPSNNVTYLANFTSNGAATAVITLVANPAGSASLLGGGTYSVGSSVIISVTPSNGWTFLLWNDNDPNSTRLVTVPAGGITYTASFLPIMTTVQVLASPAYGGTVTGGGSYRVGSYAALTATPATGWTFTGWSDGSLAGSHAITVPMGGGSYTANFRPTLGTALGAPGLTWSSGGNASWAGQSTVKHDGLAAAQSGAIGDGQSSWLQTTTNGPGSLLFWWKVSSEAGHDYLSFIVDSTTTNRISGNVDWTQFAVFLGAGSHTCRWEYAKDGSGSAGSDAGWVGQVAWSPCPAATNAPQALFKEPNGLLVSWVLETNSTFRFTRILANIGAWQPKAIGDIDGDGTGDIIFQNSAGDVALWFMNADGTTRASRYLSNTGPWEVRACADYLAAGRANIFFQTPAGATAYWQTDTNGVCTNSVFLGNISAWQLKAAADLDNDLKAELLWQMPGGLVAAWFHTGSTIRGQLLGNTGTWELCGALNSSPANNGTLLWQTPDGNTANWLVDTNGVMTSALFYGNTGSWKLKAAGR